MIDDPYDPARWGIDSVTAADILRFDAPGLPRISSGRFGDMWPTRALTARVPDIEEIATHADSGGWYWETTPPHPVFRRIEDVDSPRLNAWTTEDNASLTAKWTPELDNVVDEFIDVYGSAWPDAISVAAPESNAVTGFVHDLIASGDIDVRSREGYTREVLLSYKLANALATGPFNVTVLRRSWNFPTVRTCVCCGAEHYYDLARYYLIRTFGGPGICAPCMRGARYGDVPLVRSRSQILGALRDYSDLTSTTPARTFRESVYTAAMSDEDRGLAIALLLSIPDSAVVMEATNCSNWLNVLRAAGIVGPEGWRPGRGTVCMATDGHYCRSLAEKAICDWLYARGVSHVTEPRWPQHPELNPSGKLRADWAIGDVYIEFAGMMGEQQYREKIGKKIRLADAVGIKLIVLQPEDLPRLSSALGMFCIAGDPNSKIRGYQSSTVGTERFHAEGQHPPSGVEATEVNARGLTHMESTEDGTNDREPASAPSELGSSQQGRSMEPKLVVAIAESVDSDGNFTVEILNPAGNVVHAAKLNRDGGGQRMDHTFEYESPFIGAFDVRIAIRSVVPRINDAGTEAAAPDDYGYDDYR